MREDGGGRQSEEGPASGEWKGRTEEEAGIESSKEEEVTARGADGGAATGARGADARRRGATAGGARLRICGCVCEWIRREEIREMDGLAVALFSKMRYC